MAAKEKNRNYSIDVARMVCALLVIMCHTDLFIDVDYKLYMLFAQCIPRFTVPFFFCVSGYYYITGLMQGRNTWKKQLFALLKIYGAWTMVYYMASFVINVVLGDEKLGQFLLERVLFFFTRGSYSHFWYFPALIYALLLTTLFYHFWKRRGVLVLTSVSVLLWIISAFGTAYLQVGSHIPVLRILYASQHFEVLRDIFGMGLPCFLIGYWLYCLKEHTEQTSQKKAFVFFSLGLLGFTAEIILYVFVLQFEEQPIVMLTPYLFILFLFQLLLKNPMPELKKISGYCKPLSGFLYYIHPLLILSVGLAGEGAGVTVPTILLYPIVIVLALLCGIVCLKSKSRVLHFFI